MKYFCPEGAVLQMKNYQITVSHMIIYVFVTRFTKRVFYIAQVVINLIRVMKFCRKTSIVRANFNLIA